MKHITIQVKKNQEKVIPFIFLNEQVETTLDIYLVGENAKLTIIGIFLGNKTNNCTFNTNVYHNAPKTKSLTTIRGVFFNRSVFSNDGIVRISKGAKGADGYFASKIVLFDDAKGRSVPSLEIDENDLKAGHASTVGRPDENQLLYLKSRGVLQKDAEKLLITGFFDPLILLLPKDMQESTRKQISSCL